MWTMRLTPEQQTQMLEAYQRGDPVIDIAERFGVHHSYPTLLARRRGIQTRSGRENCRYADQTAQSPPK